MAAEAPDRRVARLAARQHGVVARRQLLSVGLGEDAIQLRIDAGRLYRVQLGVYAVGHPGITLKGDWMAAVLAAGPTAMLSHLSAGLLWRIVDLRSEAIHVSVTTRSSRGRPGLIVHRPRTLSTDQLEIVDAIPVTSVPRTILDLAGILSSSQLVRALESADQRGILDRRQLTRICDNTTGLRGLSRLRRIIKGGAGGDPRTRSPLERRLLRLCRKHGLAMPAVNVPLEGYEVDAVWPDARLVVEVDGFKFHRTRAAFEHDRARDTALQLAGYRVIRLTHRRLNDEPEAVVAALRGLLRRAGQHPRPK